jgi:hypothetical protein
MSVYLADSSASFSITMFTQFPRWVLSYTLVTSFNLAVLDGFG